MELSEDEKIELAHSTHVGMLHDHERHQKYHQALKRVVSELKGGNCEEVFALDIGGGTGILSMMAAEAGCTLVTTCESSELTARVAEKVVRTNNLNQHITIVCKSSHDLKIPEDMPRKADLLVTEIFDSELIGEGVLTTLRDAHQRLLHDNTRVVPSGADINIQLIESDLLWGSSQVKFDQLGIPPPQSCDVCPGWAAGHEVQINQLYPKHVNLLSSPTKLTYFDFSKPFYHSSSPNGLKYSKVKVTVTVTSDGFLHGLVYWWDLILHEDITLSMKPGWLRGAGEEHVWREHWMPALYYLPKPLHVKENEKLQVTMFHDDYSVWFDITRSAAEHTRRGLEYIDRPLCCCGLHVTCPREKFTLLNDKDMHSYYSKILSQCADLQLSNIAIGGDVSVLPQLLTRKSTMKVKYIECNPFARDKRNKSSKSDNSEERIENIEWNSTEMFKVSECELVICEPYFASSLLSWQHLRVWKQVQDIREINPQAKIFPLKAVLKACTVTFKDLWRIREPVRSIESFDLSDYDEVVSSALAPLHIKDHGSFQAVEPHLMWEYKHEMKASFVLKEFDLSEEPPTSCVSFKGLMNNIGRHCNAVVLWMDFEVMKGCDFRTGLNERDEWVFYSKQGVYFLNNVDIETSALDFNILLDPEEFEFLFSFTPCSNLYKNYKKQV